MRELDFYNFHKGCICYNEKKEAGVLLSIELKDELKGLYHAVGVYLDGRFDCEYRRTWIKDVKTRSGWTGNKLRMVGFINHEDLEDAIRLADTGQSFGTEVEE